MSADFDIDGRLYRCRICVGAKWDKKSNAERHLGSDPHGDIVLLRAIPVITPVALPSVSQLRGTPGAWIPGTAHRACGLHVNDEAKV
jgi:hypothetical protein